jgi:hypothetical protein
VRKLLPIVLVILFLEAPNLFAQVAADSTELFDSGETAGVPTVSTVVDGLLTRRTYDDSYRLRKIESWKMTEKAEDAVLVRLIRYEYTSGSQLLVSSVDTDYAAGVEIIRDFDSSGRIAEEQHAVLKKTADKTEKIVETVTDTDYDRENRVTVRTVTHFIYNDAGALQKKNRTVLKYNYGGKGERPDLEEYKNDKLEKRVMYTDRSTYVQSLFFDDGYEVRTTFSNGSKIVDRFLKDGAELRRKTYE